MKPSEAAEIVMMLIAAYPNARLTPSTSQVYESALADLDCATVRKAVTRLLATSKWLPTIAEIRAGTTDLELGPARDGGQAWQDAMAAVRRVGRYGVPKFLDPLVSEALRLWGSWLDF
ncbi:MAG TPA: replicative helicase loader/inhibitor, partial [Gemmatimonadaceae bacterium]